MARIFWKSKNSALTNVSGRISSLYRLIYGVPPASQPFLNEIFKQPDSDVTQSMSHSGTPRDSAVIENRFVWIFFGDCTDVSVTIALTVFHDNDYRPAFEPDYRTPAQFMIAQES